MNRIFDLYVPKYLDRSINFKGSVNDVADLSQKPVKDFDLYYIKEIDANYLCLNGKWSDVDEIFGSNYTNKYEKKIYDKGFNEGRSYEFSRIMVKLESLPLFDTKGKLENFLDYLREEGEDGIHI